MPRTKKSIRPVSIHLKLPEDLVAQIELELFSELAGRAPQGAKQAFFERLVRDHFATREGQRAALATPEGKAHVEDATGNAVATKETP